MTERAYVLSVSRGRGRRKHIVTDGVLNMNGSFKTLCGMWGSSKTMPWYVGESRVDAPGWCRRCMKAKAAR